MAELNLRDVNKVRGKLELTTPSSNKLTSQDFIIIPQHEFENFSPKEGIYAEVLGGRFVTSTGY